MARYPLIQLDFYLPFAPKPPTKPRKGLVTRADWYWLPVLPQVIDTRIRTIKTHPKNEPGHTITWPTPENQPNNPLPKPYAQAQLPRYPLIQLDFYLPFAPKPPTKPRKGRVTRADRHWLPALPQVIDTRIRTNA
ncbi:hypothetical protein [Corynebacterium mustelae]|uniref:hypothetical protein n=1 Tax=Corynebacterium mustelae TaxID=571915 RepID=UPI0006416066|nr:hypothetical protein [Corynebacterium mustelae]